MEARVRQLQRMLEDAVIVDGTTNEEGVVTTGVVVELRYDGDEDTERFLVGSIEEKGEGIAVVSPASPLGQALLGRVAGETVEYEAPNGRLAVQIVSVGA
jgi:transcription elongation factor GreA